MTTTTTIDSDIVVIQATDSHRPVGRLATINSEQPRPNNRLAVVQSNDRVAANVQRADRPGTRSRKRNAGEGEEESICCY